MDFLTGILLLIIAISFWIVLLVLPSYKYANKDGYTPEKNNINMD